MYRYLRGQINAQQTRSTLASNLQAAVPILSSVEHFHWGGRIQRRSDHGFWIDTIESRNSDKDSRIRTLVTISALAFLNDLTFSHLSKLTRAYMQLNPLAWALVTAIFLNDRATVEALLTLEPDMIARMSLLADPLRIAVREQNHDLVRLLLDSGADLNMVPFYYSMTPGSGDRMALEHACILSDVKMVELMVEPQYRLQCYGHEFEGTIRLTVRLLAEQPDRTGAYLEIMHLLLQNALPDERRPLQHFVVRLAVAHGIEPLLLMVLGMGYDLGESDHDQHTHLYHAAVCGHVEMARILLAHGASQSHERHHDAVRAAIIHGHVDVLRLLLTRATSVDEYGHALAAGHLLVATQRRYGQDKFLAVLECLCECGLDLAAANFGVNALKYAVDSGDFAMKQYLLARGVGPVPVKVPG